MKATVSMSAPLPLVLTDEEAITLRRVAFGESEARTLRPEDLQRLLKLGLINWSAGRLKLTGSGQKHFDSLPRALFAKPRRHIDS